MEQSSDQIMELTGDKLRELTNAIEDEEDDDDVCFFSLKPLNKSESDVGPKIEIVTKKIIVLEDKNIREK